MSELVRLDLDREAVGTNGGEAEGLVGPCISVTGRTRHVGSCGLVVFSFWALNVSAPGRGVTRTKSVNVSVGVYGISLGLGDRVARLVGGVVTSKLR